MLSDSLTSVSGCWDWVEPKPQDPGLQELVRKFTDTTAEVKSIAEKLVELLKATVEVKSIADEPRSLHSPMVVSSGFLTGCLLSYSYGNKRIAISKDRRTD